jgi:hypothetical protein
MDASVDSFWHDLVSADLLNQVIWDESVAVQLAIGPPEQLRNDPVQNRYKNFLNQRATSRRLATGGVRVRADATSR